MSNSKTEKIRQECTRDEEIQILREYLRNGFPDDNSKLSGNLRQHRALAADLYEQDGLILHNNRIVIPSGLRKDILFRIHEGHLGMDKCKALARSAVFWPGINNDIENTVRRWPTCNMFRSKQAAEPLWPHPIPVKPYQKVGADVFTIHGKDYLIVVDYLSKFRGIRPADEQISCRTSSRDMVFLRRSSRTTIHSAALPCVSLPQIGGSRSSPPAQISEIKRSSRTMCADRQATHAQGSR